MTVSIIIVNYKTPQLTKNCIESVFAQTASTFTTEVIVVDNYSNDGIQNLLTSFPTEIKFIQMGYNAGFARANNAGIRASTGNIILLLNSDTITIDNAINNCANLFNKSAYAACGIQLLNEDRTPQISGNYAMKGGLNYLLPLPYIGNCIKWLGSALNIKKPNILNATLETEVDWINGAFLMVKKNAVEKAGLMDEDFFLYAEEPEWCSRLKKTGKLCVYGQYNIIHLQGESANQTFGSSGKGYYNLYDKKGLQIMLSNFLRIRKEFGVGWFLIHMLSYTLAAPVFFIFSFFENIIRFKNPFSQFKLAYNFSRNILRLWSFTLRIILNRPYFYKVL